MKCFWYSEAMLSIICWSLVVSLVINEVMFLIAFRLKSDKLTDISYAISFVALALFALYRSTGKLYTVIGAILVCAWALRIGSFLLYRVMRNGSDRRFDGIREHFWLFGRFWLGQALTVWLLMVPIILIAPKDNEWHMFSCIGIAVWAIGFVLESMADLQKYRFRHNPANKNRWIENGVWRYSRHPNYFGEILVWVGVYLYALPDLSMSARFVSIISPLFITVLLRYVSGIPILEKGADLRWGDIPAYKTYKRRTRLLIPLPIKR
jgi:steroid 5-alpha reductase family enzyme